MGIYKQWLVYGAALLITLFAGRGIVLAQTPGAGIKAQIDSVNALSFQYITTNPVEAEPQLLESVHLADSIGYLKGKADSYSHLSILYNYMSKWDLSIEYRLKAIDLYEGLGMIKEAGNSYAELGYGMRRRDKDRGEYFMRKGISILQYFEGSIKLADAYNNYAVIKLEKGQLDSALHFAEQSLEIKKANNDSLGIAYSLGNLGTIYSELGNFDVAIDHLKQSSKMRRALGDFSGLAIDLHNIGAALDQQGRREEALSYYKQSLHLGLEIDYQHLIEYNYGVIAGVFESMGVFDSALYYQKKYSDLHEQRVNETTNNKLAELEVQFETEQKEKELAVKRAALSQEQLKVRQRNWVLSVLGGLFLVGVFISGLIIRQQKIKRENLTRENKLKIQLANAEMENKIHEERERISRDLHDNVGAHITNLIAGIEISNLHVRKDQRNDALDLLSTLDSDARGAMNELRETIWLLDKEEVEFSSFNTHLKDYINRQQHYLEKVKVNLSVNIDEPAFKLNPVQSLHLLRIIQEALTNVQKYSEAQNFNLCFEKKEKNLILTLEDDGKGFDVDDPSISGNGLKNMERRTKELQGSINIKSKPGKGVSIKIVFPLIP